MKGNKGRTATGDAIRRSPRRIAAPLALIGSRVPGVNIPSNSLDS